MYYLIIGAAGAAITILISMASRSNFYLLSALIPLFPTFSLISYYMVKQQGEMNQLRNVIQFNIASLIPFLAFACAMYVLHTLMNFHIAVAISVIVWGLAAFLTYYIYNTYL